MLFNNSELIYLNEDITLESLEELSDEIHFSILESTAITTMIDYKTNLYNSGEITQESFSDTVNKYWEKFKEFLKEIKIKITNFINKAIEYIKNLFSKKDKDKQDKNSAVNHNKTNDNTDNSKKEYIIKDTYEEFLNNNDIVDLFYSILKKVEQKAKPDHINFLHEKNLRFIKTFISLKINGNKQKEIDIFTLDDFMDRLGEKKDIKLVCSYSELRKLYFKFTFFEDSCLTFFNSVIGNDLNEIIKAIENGSIEKDFKERLSKAEEITYLQKLINGALKQSQEKIALVIRLTSEHKRFIDKVEDILDKH